MAVTAVVGANFGDEGKGRIVDALAAEFDYVVRYQGGANAGHTVLPGDGRFVLHQLPSGVFSRRAVNVIGPGVALDIEKLCAEMDALAATGGRPLRLAISERAQLLLPWHRLLDAYEEDRLGSRAFGSTRSGIAPCYADKYAKLGVMVDDLFDDDGLRARLEQALEIKNALVSSLYQKRSFASAPVLATLRALRERLAPFVCDTTRLLHEALEAGR